LTSSVAVVEALLAPDFMLCLVEHRSAVLARMKVPTTGLHDRGIVVKGKSHICHDGPGKKPAMLVNLHVL
jgi:hypothetical protein